MWDNVCVVRTDVRLCMYVCACTCACTIFNCSISSCTFITRAGYWSSTLGQIWLYIVFFSLCVRQAPNHITSIVLLAFSFGFFLRKIRESSPLSPNFSHIIIVYFYSSRSRIISISSLNTSVYIFICSIFLSLSVSISVPFTRLLPSPFCYFHFLCICFVSAASVVFVVVLVTVTWIDIGLWWY